MSAPEARPSLTLRMFVTGRGVRQLSARDRLIVDLTTALVGAPFVAGCLFLYVSLWSRSEANPWLIGLFYGGFQLILAAIRYGRARRRSPRVASR